MVQVFTSGALTKGSLSYWVLVVFVGGMIALSVVTMAFIVAFETYRALRFSRLYQELRCVW